MGIFPADSSSSEITNTVSTSTANLPVYKDYAWDFNNDDYIIKDGNLVVLEKNEALKVWIYKALKTQRFRYLAYSLYYGNDFEDIIGKSYTNDEIKVKLKQLIENCLLVNPYISSIDSVDVELDGNKLIGTIYLTTVYGSIKQEVNQDV